MFEYSYAEVCIAIELYSLVISFITVATNPGCISHWLCLKTSVFGFISAMSYYLITQNEKSQLYVLSYLWTLFLSNLTHSYIPVLRLWYLCEKKEQRIFFAVLPVCLFFGAFSTAYTEYIYKSKEEFRLECKRPIFQLLFFISLVIVSLLCLVVVVKEFKMAGLPRLSQSLRVFEKISIFSLILVIAIGCVQSILVLQILGQNNFAFLTHILAFVCSISHGMFELNRQNSRLNRSVQFMENFT
eukprot:NODE_33_length_32023_cov_0.217579.p12 type:complete len:243 gc:universal NODE_33_length_32023_cov_0.217579:10488-11216(+)